MPIARVLDLSEVGCPDNYVRAALALEDMGVGEVLEIVLYGQEAAANVPRSLKQAGHKIVAVQRDEDGTLRLRIEKAQVSRNVKCG